MVLLVPFDGSDLSTEALRRANEFSGYTDEPILALSIVPDTPDYAIKRGWVDQDDQYDPEAIGGQLAEQVAAIAPEAEFRCEIPEAVSSRASVTTDVVRTIREVAHEEDASIVFIGSENAGRVSSPVCSVGAPLSEDPGYDVHIVRHVEQAA